MAAVVAVDLWVTAVEPAPVAETVLQMTAQPGSEASVVCIPYPGPVWGPLVGIEPEYSSTSSAYSQSSRYVTQSAVIALDIGSVAARLRRNLAALVLPRTGCIDWVSVFVSRIEAVAVEVGFGTVGQQLGAASRCFDYPGLAAATEAY